MSALAALALSAAGLALANALHCAGMCGAFALVARGRPEWHLGRTATYVGLGLAAGAIGGATGLGGAEPTIRLVGAVLASAVLVVFSLQLGGFLRRPVGAVAHKPNGIILTDLVFKGFKGPKQTG